MKNHSCEQEQAIAAAVRAGTLDATLLAHANRCPICSDVLLVAEFLQADSTSLERDLNIPDAVVLWKKAELRAKEKALAKATLPIRVARISAGVVAFVVAVRLIIDLSHPPAWLPDLGVKHFPSIDANWLAALTGTTVVAIAATVVCLGLSSWYVMRQE